MKVKAGDNIKYVDMWLDASLPMKKNKWVVTVCTKVSRNIALIRHYRKYLSVEPCQKLASGLVMAILDY